MSPDHFWDITPRQTRLIIDGYSERIERETRLSWEQVRWQTSILLQPHARKGRAIRPTDLIRFDWDGEIQSIDKEEIQRRLDMIARRFGQIKTYTLPNGEVISGAEC